MAFRVVLLENDMNVHYKLNSLVFEKADGNVSIPISDISTIVIDNLKINISTRTLCHLAESNISVIFCDQEHLPIGMFGSYDNHSRMSKKIQFQIKMSSEKYDEIWKSIVKAKICNQAKALGICRRSTDVQAKLFEYANEIENGDATNREGHAAKLYFNELMGTSFSRGNEDILLNSGLDYGYTIIRSYLARLCVGYGLNSELGIHHRNEYNRFNLIDDLIEPIRPFVDCYVYKTMKDAKYFTAEHRHGLVNLLNHKVKYTGRNSIICNMLDEYVAAYAAGLEKGTFDICYPDVEDFEV